MSASSPPVTPKVSSTNTTAGSQHANNTSTSFGPVFAVALTTGVAYYAYTENAKGNDPVEAFKSIIGVSPPSLPPSSPSTPQTELTPDTPKTSKQPSTHATTTTPQPQTKNNSPKANTTKKDIDNKVNKANEAPKVGSSVIEPPVKTSKSKSISSESDKKGVKKEEEKKSSSVHTTTPQTVNTTETHAATTTTQTPPTPTPTTTPDISSSYTPILTSARASRLSNLETTSSELAVLNAAMKKELSETVLKDLDKLGEDELRYRVVQMAAEMAERTKWEAVRIKEFLVQNEARISSEWEGRMLSQRLSMEEAMSRELREQEDRIEKKNMKERRDELESTKKMFEEAWEDRQKKWVKAMQEEMEVKLGNEIIRIKSEYSAKLKDLVSRGTELEGKIKSLQDRVKMGEGKTEKSTKVHRIVGGVMGLVGDLEEGKKGDIEAAKIILSGDKVIGAALEKVEKCAKSGGGIWTLSELQERWGDVKREGRKMVLTGEGKGTDGLGGVLMGEIMGMIMVEVGEDKAMKKEGSSVSDEDRLVRAGVWVKNGKLEKAVDELKSLQGKKVKKVTEGFLKDAENKIGVDQAITVMKLRASVLSSSMK